MVINSKLLQKYVKIWIYHRKGIHIKNKFYTRVRKAIRQVNSVIDFYYSKKFVPFSFSVISKLVALISKNVEELKY